jgi:hypothetical protein
MPRPATLLVVCLAVPTSLVVGCGGDSTSPENDGPASFARMIGSTPAHETPATAVTVLSDGTRMVCGDFDGTLHVTESPDSISSGGGPRNFLAGFQPDGSVSFMTQIAGGAVGMRRMAHDPDDNLLLVGSFGGTSTFGGISLNAVNLDIIFAKLDRTGHTIWVQSGSGSGIDEGKDITTASDGNIYMTGTALSEMSVAGEDVGQNGHQTGFIVKLRSDGVGVWQGTGTVSAGSSSCEGVAVSEDGTIVVCGFYSVGSVDFSGDVLTNDGGFFDAFIGRFGPDGTPLGSIHIGGPDLVDANDVTTLDNDAVVTGAFDGTADFDVLSAGGSVTASGNLNAYVARYSKAGALRWVKTFGPGDNQNGLSISRLSGDRVLVCGQFTTTITLGSTTLTSAGGTDAFIGILDGSGRVLRAGKVGGGGAEGVAVTAAAGSTAIIVGESDSKDLIFPGGTHRHKFGTTDSYIFQMP